ncbi:MAG: helix-turn-helix domain-containing protein [Anaerolinea sp.]
MNVPAHEQVINDLETLKVLADPLRLRIRELLAQPSTVKQIAAELGIPATKLYYHVNLLEKHGLIAVVESRLVSGIMERVYQVTAYRVQVAPHLLTGDAQNDDTLTRSIISVFNNARQDLLDGITSGTVDTSTSSEVHQGAKIVSLRMSLTDEQARSLFALIDSVIDEFTKISDSNRDAHAPNTRSYRLFSAVFPTQPPDAAP